jgi:hypothetical protein
MIASQILTKGVEQGIITAEQAERLRALEGVREPLELPASPDDEQLRFIGGFSDIFVTIGLAMFLGAIGYFALLAGSRLGMWIALAIVAWLLAEFFTRLKRMARGLATAPCRHSKPHAVRTGASSPTNESIRMIEALDRTALPMVRNA